MKTINQLQNKAHDLAELEIRKNNAEYKYLVCIWCGGNISLDKKEAMYCSDKCKYHFL